MGQWQRINHKGEMFGERYNVAEFLASALNDLGTTNNPVIIQHDPSNGVFEAIVYVGDVEVKEDQGTIYDRPTDSDS
jgi:hypothetical protein